MSTLAQAIESTLHSKGPYGDTLNITQVFDGIADVLMSMRDKQEDIAGVGLTYLANKIYDSNVMIATSLQDIALSLDKLAQSQKED